MTGIDDTSASTDDEDEEELLLDEYSAIFRSEITSGREALEQSFGLDDDRDDRFML